MAQVGSKVRVLRPENYWYRHEGVVVNVDQSGAHYSHLVRFEKPNYTGQNTCKFMIDELLEIAPPPTKPAKP